MNEALRLPGLSNAWTMPIKGRMDMIATGIRTPVGLKISGADLRVIEEIGIRVESVLASVEGTRSVFAERTSGGYFLDIEWDREELARYGLSIAEAQEVVAKALAGSTQCPRTQSRRDATTPAIPQGPDHQSPHLPAAPLQAAYPHT